jgi:hypothetical protein
MKIGSWGVDSFEKGSPPPKPHPKLREDSAPVVRRIAFSFEQTEEIFTFGADLQASLNDYGLVTLIPSFAARYALFIHETQRLFFCLDMAAQKR